MKKRICFLCYWYYGGISLPSIYELSKAISKLGWYVDVIALGQEDKERSPQERLKIIELSCPVGVRLTKFQFLYKAAATINKEDYDLIHVYWSPFTSLLPIMSRSKSTKWVMDIRSVAIEGGLIANVKNFLCGIESKNFDSVAIIDVNILKYFPVLRKRNAYVFELPIGVNIEIFKPVSLEKKKKLKAKSEFDDSTVLIYVGKMDITRQLSKLIKAFWILKNKLNCKDVNLLMVGDGTDREKIQELATELGLQKNIIFTGIVPYRQVKDYIALADIALSYVPMNRVYNYQPPLKTLEYLSCGLPQVATRTKANEVLIDNGVNGLLSDDLPEEFANNIKTLLDDKLLQKKIKSNCIESAIPHNWSSIVKKLLVPAYKKILNT